MKEQTTKRLFRASEHHAQIEQLYLELAEFNRRIAGLEKPQANTRTTEILKASAIVLAQQLDEVRCAVATENLASLLAK
jgi:uncharacterized coiled-coil DUF342 family protein